MIKSMTGYGRAVATIDGREITAEIRSVNNRYLDCTVKMPRLYAYAEDGVKSRVKASISRGKVDVFIAVNVMEDTQMRVCVNRPVLEGYLNAMKSIAADYDVRDDITVTALSRLPDVFSVEKAEEDEEKLTADILSVVDAALEKYTAMRVLEGAALEADLRGRAATILSLVEKVEQRSPVTLAEYRARNEGKTEKKVYYTTDAARQAASVALYTARNIDVVVMDSVIDISFMQHMEQQEDADGLTFARVDADVDGLVDKDAENSELALEPLEKLFRDALGDEQLKVKLQPLADGDLPLMLLEDEQMRRYREMAAMYGDNFKLPERAEVVLNSKCEAIRALAAVKDPELQKLLAKQYFDIARMSTRPLENEELSAFIRQSYQLAARLAEKED